MKSLKICLIAMELVILALSLGACKSDESEKITPPSAPVLSMTLQKIKTFQFSWNDVAEETQYRLFEDRDGEDTDQKLAYTQVATIAADATSYDYFAFLPNRINAHYKLQACNVGGCTDSNEVKVSDSGTLIDAAGYVKASNTGASDQFGYSIALSDDGNTMAVGAPWESSNANGVFDDHNDDAKIANDAAQADNSAENSGAVYVFTRNNYTWSQQAYVKASNSESNDEFGWHVALSADGSTLAVSAPFEDSNATGIKGEELNNTATDSGALYLFTRSSGSWSQQAYIKASNTGSMDNFGYVIALSDDGNTLVAGAPREDSSSTGIINANQTDNSAENSGAAYVFKRTDATWSQQVYVKASNTGNDDWFGSSVALSADGNTLAVGAPGEDSNAKIVYAGTAGADEQKNNTATNSGAVYVFIRSSSTWTQHVYVKASNTDSNTESEDYFGFSVALSADGYTLAVGAPWEDSNAKSINPKDNNKDQDQQNNSYKNSGAVYVFTRNSTSWSQHSYVKASNSGSGDYFGISVALSSNGNSLAVGADWEQSNAKGFNGVDNDLAENSGAVYLFALSTDGWNQKVYVKSSNTEANDSFGRCVAFSADGKTLAIGAVADGLNQAIGTAGEDSSATGINGDQDDNSAPQSGAVYLY